MLLSRLATAPELVVQCKFTAPRSGSYHRCLVRWKHTVCITLQVLRCRKLQQSSSSGPPPGKPARALHTMLTLQLDSFDADRNIVSSRHLAFIELAAPEPKVGDNADLTLKLDHIAQQMQFLNVLAGSCNQLSEAWHAKSDQFVKLLRNCV